MGVTNLGDLRLAPGLFSRANIIEFIDSNSEIPSRVPVSCETVLRRLATREPYDWSAVLMLRATCPKSLGSKYAPGPGEGISTKDY